MKIDQIEIVLFQLPLVAPFSISGGTVKTKEGVLVKLVSDGLIGWGECASPSMPIYLEEYSRASFAVSRDFLAPRIVGRSFSSVDELVSCCRDVKGYSFAKAAFETAFWHLQSQLEQSSLRELLGGVKTSVEVGHSIGIHDSVSTLLGVVGQSLEEGYKRIKLKIMPGWDAKIVHAVRREFGNIPLMVDANSAYSLADLAVFKELDQCGLMMIEQPLSCDDIVDHAQLQSQLSTPICLDESIRTCEDARKALSMGSCRIINIKPGRVGGLQEAKLIHDYCLARDVPVWCGGMLESSIGRYHNLSIASLPGFSLPADMSPSSLLFERDIVTRPLRVENGIAVVPTSLEDFGVNEEAIRSLTIENVQVGAR